MRIIFIRKLLINYQKAIILFDVYDENFVLF